MFVRLFTVSVLIAAIVFIAILKRSQSDSNPVTASIADETTISFSTGDVQIDDEPISKEHQVSRAETDVISDDAFDAENEIFEPLNEAFVEISEKFEEAIQYPTFSFPITTPDAIQKYRPNQGAQVGIEGPQYSFNLKTDKLIVSASESIKGRLSVSGITAADARIVLLDSGMELAALTVPINSSNVSFELPPLGQSWQSDSILVVATVSHNSEELTVNSPIQKMQETKNVSELTDVDESYVDGSWLRIPVKVTIRENGFYRLEANLYSKKSGLPLIHLVDEQFFDSGSRSFVLSAHISALMKMNDEGDYVLRDLWLEQMPSPPNFENLPGVVSSDNIVVTGFPFSDYVNEPFVDPEAQARLEFLQSISD